MRTMMLTCTLAALLSAPAVAQTAPEAAPPLLIPPPFEKERIAQPPAPLAPPPVPVPVVVKPAVTSKWNAVLYGFAEYDAILDTVQGLNDGAANAAIPRNATYAGNHARFTNAVRNSRLGVKLGGPDSGDIKTSGVLEMDFLGNQPSGTSEAALLTSPLLRVRHLNMKIETPVVDVVIGQTWQLFGAQPLFHPNTVEIQGVPGQVYSRAPQLRLSRIMKSDAVNVEVALAAVRPVQRDNNAAPDGQAALKVALNNWKGVHTAGSTGTGVDPLTIAVSGLVRRIELPEFAAKPVGSRTTTGWGLSVDALVPIVPATLTERGNALTLTGSFATGEGIADLFSGLSGGVSNASLANPDKLPTAPAYTANNIDGGIAVFKADGTLHAVQWQAWIAGVQYYLPPKGNVWLSANYADLRSNNAKQLGAAASVFDKANWFDVNLFWDATPAVRVGAEFARFHQTYADLSEAQNLRGQVSAFYIF